MEFTGKVFRKWFGDVAYLQAAQYYHMRQVGSAKENYQDVAIRTYLHSIALSEIPRYTISKMRQSGCGLEKLKTEIIKCIIVCSNCHREIHAGLIEV